MAETTFDTAYKKIKVLVEDFQRGSARFMNTTYKEHEARQDFINPFFEALGWDVSHKQQRDPFRQEVKGEKTEREGIVDYSFYLAPDFKNPVFFVEAKKPALDIKSENFYIQTIKYSWNAGLPVSILTDFQQLHILDCRNKAKAGDGSAFIGDHKEYVFTDYLDKEKFAEIYYTFSREAVEAGNITKYVDALRKPKGKAVQAGLFKGAYRAVDEDFLAYIDELRELLAKALKKNNEDLDSEALTESTQRIIDRLVFIRFLEDKQILDDTYVDKFGEKGTAWADFVSTSLNLNTQYNGVVFKKHFIDEKSFKGPDDRAFRDICRDMCSLNSEYNFRYIPIHILGSIYERFLGKVVHATDKRVRIEEKPEVRKAGGVYYTPKYIVEYIVDNTVGTLIRDKTPKQIEKLTFADIACGSGSFLISVYEHLLDYHTFYYNKPTNLEQALKDGCRKDEEGIWRLSIEQKQSILTNNVYGVDIDYQAVEVTQLSLYLKMLENENVVTVAKHLQKKGRLFGADKILPDLSNNVKCGNSLIASDISNDKLFDDEEYKKLNPFDYESEFPKVFKTKSVTKAHIFKPDLGIDETQIVSEPMIIYNSKERGGFDAIVGNPPYVRIQHLKATSLESVDYFKSTYFSAQSGNYDLYILFVEKAIKILNNGGHLGYILPNKFFNTDYGLNLRQTITSKELLNKVVDFTHHQVFDSATTYCCLLFLTNSINKTFEYTKATPSGFQLQDELLFEELRASDFNSDAWRFGSELGNNLVKKLTERSINLIDLPCDISRGSSTGNDKVFVLKKRADGSFENGYGDIVVVETDILKIPVYATDFNRYEFKTDTEYVLIFPYYFRDGKTYLLEESELKTNYPKTFQYLSSKKKVLELRKQNGKWYSYSAARNLLLHSKANIIIPLLANKGLFTCLPADKSDYTLMAGGGFSITILDENYNDKFILGLINSSLLFWYLNQLSNVFRGGWITCTKQYFSLLPIINLNDKSDRKQHDHIVAMVEQMIQTKHKLALSNTNRDKEVNTRRIEHLDWQIENAVFELYGITEEEKELILNK